MDLITDHRRGFFKIENAVMSHKLGPQAGWLYCVIAFHADSKTGESFPSISTIVKESGMARATVVKYLKVLESCKLIRVERSQKPGTQANEVNHYHLLSAPNVVKEVNQVEPDLVQEVNHPSSGGEPPLVQEVNCNKTHLNKTQEQEDSTADKSAVTAPKKSTTKKPKHKHPDFIHPVQEELVAAFGLVKGEMPKPAKNNYYKVAVEITNIDNPVCPHEVNNGPDSLMAYCRLQSEQGNRKLTINSISSRVPNWRAWLRSKHNEVVPAQETPLEPEVAEIDAGEETGDVDELLTTFADKLAG
jgi:hypothetical protein